MTIVVEDGSSVSGANSYASEKELTDYAEDRGITLTDKPSVLLIKAMDYLALSSSRFSGAKATSSQSLPWPRIGATVNGAVIPDSSVPQELKTALIELAIAADSTELLSFKEAGGKQGAVIEERVEGVVDVTYSDAGYRESFYHPYVDSLLKSLFSSNIGFGNCIARRS